MRNIFPSKLCLKIIASILIPVILMGGAFVTLFTYSNLKWYQQEIIDSQIQLMDLLLINLRSSFIRQDYESIREQLSEFAGNKEIHRIRLITKDGKILFDSQGGDLFGDQIGPSAQECLSCHRSEKIEVPHSVMQINLQGESKIFRHFVPCNNQKNCQVCHSESEGILGFFLADFKQTNLSKKKMLFLTQILVSSLVTILVILVILFITLRRMVDFPLQQIIARIQGISVISGSLSHIDFISKDEIGELVDLINELAEKLKHSQEELVALYQTKSNIASTLDFEKKILSSTIVNAVMETEMDFIYDYMSIKEIMELIKKSPNLFFPVIDNEKKYLGTITLHELRNVLVEQALGDVIYARDFYCSAFPYILASGTLQEATDIVLERDIAFLPVVDERKRLVGILNHTHIFQILKAALLKRVGM